MVNVVLDTNIYVSSIFWDKGPSHDIVDMALDKKITAFTSIEILKELEKVLRRDFKEPEDIVQRQIALICEYAAIVVSSQKLNVVKDDPDDDKIIQCAVSSKAQYIVTGDKHLLGIGEYKGIKIIKPRELIEIIKKR